MRARRDTQRIPVLDVIHTVLGALIFSSTSELQEEECRLDKRESEVTEITGIRNKE